LARNALCLVARPDTVDSDSVSTFRAGSTLLLAVAGFDFWSHGRTQNRFALLLAVAGFDFWSHGRTQNRSALLLAAA
jgi:hypothetical protein